MKQISTLLLFVFLLSANTANAQTTSTVQTFDFSNPARTGVFSFPNDPTKTYQKITMQYRMRCKGALVSTSANRNLGCGEWDYSCNTYITDSSKTDSLKATHPDFIISNGATGYFEFTNTPTYSYKEYTQKQVTYTSTSGETTTPINTGAATTVRPLGAVANSKMQYMWTASELTAAGFTAGTINGLKFDLNQLGASLNFLQIKIKPTTKTEITGIEDSTGFTKVYFTNTTFAGVGMQHLKFYQPFTWNGTSNIIVEMSYNNTANSANRTVGGAPSFNAAVGNAAEDNYLQFDGASSHLNCGDIDALDNTQKFTYEGWVYLKEWKPWTNLFDDNGKTLMQVGGTLGEIYCIIRNPNNTYGYATLVLPERVWTHVAMVFDGTLVGNNRIKLYVNGVLKTLTYSGTLPATTEDNTTPTVIGGGTNCYMDDARVWNTALNAATIAAWMRQPVTAAHPQYASLQAAYAMNEGAGTTTADASPFNRTGIIKGNTAWGVFRGNEIVKNLTQTPERPNVGFVRGTYTMQVQNVTVLDSTPNLKQTITQYQLVGGQPVPIDTTYQYAALEQEVYNENGVVINTIPVNIDSTFTIQDLAYYSKTPQKYELMSFVTPYGIGLDLGATGKMWEFDVTDFAPILKGNKSLNITRGGENQEELDIKFVFTEGTPPRNVLAIQQVWPVIQASFQDMSANKYYEPRIITMHPNLATAKLRTAITGHGQEGEFTSRTHSINLNGGTSEYTFNLIKECSLNPIFPQGGTWVYDRMGWCPGAPTDLREFNVTQYLQPNTAATFDYNVANAVGDSRYIASHQLVQYGAANYTLDATLTEVKKPSDAVVQSRRNPVCMNPVVRITNTGSTTLTSLKITYGLVGGTQTDFAWTGSLAFMAAQDVTLNVPDLGTNAGTFQVSLSEPNGGADQNADNNTIASVYNPPLLVPSRIVIELKSNSSPTQNSFVVKNSAGTTIKSRTTPTANVTYRDTLTLTNGCYEFILTDTGNDGLTWWANTAQGSGTIRFKDATTGAILKNFNSDFGGEVYQQFAYNSTVATDNAALATEQLQVFPNPASEKLTINIVLEKSSNASIEITDLAGRIMRTETFKNIQHQSIDLDVANYPKGMYMAVLKGANGVKTVKFVVQ